MKLYDYALSTSQLVAKYILMFPLGRDAVVSLLRLGAFDHFAFRIQEQDVPRIVVGAEAAMYPTRTKRAVTLELLGETYHDDEALFILAILFANPLEIRWTTNSEKA